jgi:hypothetical protein
MHDHRDVSVVAMLSSMAGDPSHTTQWQACRNDFVPLRGMSGYREFMRILPAAPATSPARPSR